MPQAKLTDELALSEPPPPKGAPRKEIRDDPTALGGVAGLTLRITPEGVRTWTLRYRVPGAGRPHPRTGRRRAGPPQRITLGTTPAMDVSEARERAKELLKEVVLGRKDPRAGLRAAEERRRGNTVESVGERMLEDFCGKESTLAVMRGFLRGTLFPTLELGSTPVADVDLATVKRLLDDIKKRETVSKAREARKHLNRILTYAKEGGLIAINPMAGLRRPDLAYQPRDRDLNDAELRAAWIAAGTMGYPYASAIRLIILTGSRKSEILGARRAEIDHKGRTLTVSADRHKMGRAHIIPLVDEAWRIFSEAKKPAGKQPHLFVTRSGEPPALSSKVAEKFRALTEAQMREDDPDMEDFVPFTIHDLRRTCATRLAELKERQEVIDAVLGHVKTGVQGTYNKWKYLDEKREALNLYAARVLELAK